MSAPRPDPHGPIKVTPDPDGAWYACQLCQVTTLARTPTQARVFLDAHQVEPDPAWLARVDQALVDLHRAGVPA